MRCRSRLGSVQGDLGRQHVGIGGDTAAGGHRFLRRQLLLGLGQRGLGGFQPIVCGGEFVAGNRAGGGKGGAAVIVHLGARQIGLACAHLGLGAGGVGEILDGVLLGLLKIDLGLLHRQLHIGRIDGSQNLALMHQLGVMYRHAYQGSVDAGRDLGAGRLDIGIVGGDDEAADEEPPTADPQRHGNHGNAKPEKELAPQAGIAAAGRGLGGGFRHGLLMRTGGRCFGNGSV